MKSGRYNRRIEAPHSEQPMRVSQVICDLCRDNIEQSWKRAIRKILRRFFIWKYDLQQLGEGCQLGAKSKAKHALLGNFSSFGPCCEFNGPIVIGDLTMLSSEVQLIGQDHVFNRVDLPVRLGFRDSPRPVTVIESDCWIGSRVTIMEGVRIGRGSIIGATSLVTRSIPPYSIAVGIPARVVRRRFEPEAREIYDRMLYGPKFGEPNQ